MNEKEKELVSELYISSSENYNETRKKYPIKQNKE